MAKKRLETRPEAGREGVANAQRDRVTVTNEALSTLIGLAAHEVPGIIGMAPANLREGIKRILGARRADEGVEVSRQGETGGGRPLRRGRLRGQHSGSRRIGPRAGALRGKGVCRGRGHAGGCAYCGGWGVLGVKADAMKLEARDLATAFAYATDWLGVYVEEVNALNVYPVPDGDTGTNMHLTMQSVRAAASRRATQNDGGGGPCPRALVRVAAGRARQLGRDFKPDS